MKSIIELLWEGGPVEGGEGDGGSNGNGDNPNGDIMSDSPQFCLILSCDPGGGGGCDALWNAVVAVASNCGL